MRKFLFALLLLASPAAAQECVHPAVMANQVVAGGPPHAGPLALLTGSQKQAVLDVFNSAEPVSSYEVDSILVIGAPNFPMVFLIGVTGQCVVFGDTFPLDVLLSLINGGV